MPTSGTVSQGEERSSNGEDSSDRAYTETETDNDFEFPAYYKKKLETLERRQKKLESLGTGIGFIPFTVLSRWGCRKWFWTPSP